VAAVIAAVSVAVAPGPAAGVRTSPSVPVRVEVAPQHEHFDAGDVPQSVNSSDPAISTIEADVNAPIVDLDVGFRVQHARTRDLVVTLTHEQSGRQAVLMAGAACDGGVIDVVVDDGAGASAPPCDVRVRPEEALATFAGLSFAGTWRLSVRDRRGGNDGALLQWSLQPELDLRGGAVVILGDRNLDRLRSQMALAAPAPAVLAYPLGTPPTLASLHRFDAVLVYATAEVPNANAYGDLLADYVDGGGGVVVANLLWTDTIALGGRFTSDAYQVFTPGPPSTSSATLVDLGHPLTAEVGQVRARNWSDVALRPGARLVARWSSGVPAVATLVAGAGRVVGVNMAALPSDVYPGWDVGTGGDRLLAAALRGSGEAVPRCAGRPVTIEGTAGNDVLVGTRAPDVIDGRGGNDVIRGKGGDDIICGGPGRDRIFPGGGNDIVRGGRDVDRVVFAGRRAVVVRLGKGRASGQGDDVVRGVESVRGSRGDDLLVGSRRANVLAGGAGNDVLRGLAGDDILRGGPGSDIANGGPGADRCQAETTRRCGVGPLH
jgi:hypothetical protein